MPPGRAARGWGGSRLDQVVAAGPRMSAMIGKIRTKKEDVIRTSSPICTTLAGCELKGALDLSSTTVERVHQHLGCMFSSKQESFGD